MKSILLALISFAICFALELASSLEAGESKTVAFTVGYAKTSDSIQSIRRNFSVEQADSMLVELKAVRLFYITEKMSYTLREKHRDKNFYMAQEWSILDLSPDENKAVIPTDAVGRYLEFTLKDGIILTSPYEEISSGGAI